MSSLDAIFGRPDRSTLNRLYGVGDELSTERSTYTKKGGLKIADPTGDISGWDYAFYYLGKPEEWMTKAIGGLLSDDTKYRFGAGRPGDQVSFADLAGDALEGATGSRMPVLAAVLGLTAAIANPLDPLNKLKIASLTKKGVALDRVAHLRNNVSTRALFKAGKDGVVELSDTALKAEKKLAEDALRNATVAADKDAIAAATQRVKHLDRVDKERGVLNQYMREAQEEGLTFDEIRLAGSRHEQYAKGQRRMLGMSSPLKFDQLSLFRGANYNPFDEASNSMVTMGFSAHGLPLVAEMDAAVSRGISTIGKAAKTALTKVGDAITESAKYHFVGERFKPLVDRIDRALNEVELDTRMRQMQILDAKRRAMDAGIPASEFDSYVREYFRTKVPIEDDKAALLRATLEQPPEDLARVVFEGPPSVTRGLKSVRFVDAERLAGVTTDVDPITGQRVLATSELSREDIDIARNDWLSASPATKIGNRRGKLTAQHVILERGDAVDPEILHTLNELEGTVKFEVHDLVPDVTTTATTPKHNLDDLAQAFARVNLPNAVLGGKKAAEKAMEEFMDIEKYLLRHPQFGLEEVAKKLHELEPGISLDDWKRTLKWEFGSDILASDGSPMKWIKAARDQITSTGAKAGDLFDVKNTILVGRRPVGSKKGLDPIDPKDLVGVVIEPTHMYNLELLLAQMTRRGLVLDASAGAADFLFTDNGLVYLINPNVVKKAKSFKNGKATRAVDREAAQLNKIALKHLESRYGVGIPVDEPSILDSPSSIRNADDSAKVARRVRTNLDFVQGEGVFKYNALKLLRHADNTFFHEQLLFDPDAVLADLHSFSPQHSLRAVHDANDISTKAAEIQAAKLEGRVPKLDPIEVAVDEMGRLQIVRGRNDLVAAILSDMPEVNVKVHPITSVGLDTEKIFVSQMEHLSTVFKNNDEIATSYVPGNMARNYKVNENGTYKQFGHTDLIERQPNNLPYAESRKLINNVAYVFTQNSMGIQIPKKMDRVLEAMNRTSNAPDLELAEIIVQHDNLVDLKLALEDRYGVQLTLPEHLLIPGGKDGIATLADLHSLANRYLDHLASKGMFTLNTIQDPARLALYNKGVLEIYDEQSKTLRFVHQGSTVEELDRYASSALNRTFQADSIMPSYRIRLEGKDGASDKTILDYYQGTVTDLTEQIRFNRSMTVPAEEVAKLEARKIYVDPTQAKLAAHLHDGRPLIKDELASQSQGKPVYRRGLHAFYVSDTGRLFVDTRQNHAGNAAVLLNTVFGEARIPRGEFGYISPNAITLHYPLADLTVLSKGQIRLLQTRIRGIAQKMKDAGYNEGLRLDILTDLDPHVWNRMYAQGTTIGDVLNKDPKNWLRLKGDTFDFTDMMRATGPEGPSAVFRGMKAHTADTVNPKYRLAVEYADRMDDIRLRELMMSISTRFHAEYMPRIRTPYGDKAMGALRDEAFKRFNERHKGVRAIESFMLGRTLPDLTTPEINELINRLRKVEKNPNLTFDQIYTEIVEEISKKGYDGEKGTAALHWIASMMDHAGIKANSPFFYDDAIYAQVKRIEKSAEVQRKTAVVNALKEEHAAFVIKASDLGDYRKGRGEIDKLVAQRQSILKQLDEAKSAYETAKNHGTHGSVAIQELQDRITDLENKSGSLLAKIGDTEKDLITKYPNAQAFEVDLDAPIVYIDSDVARTLIHQRVLDPGDITTNLDAGLVAVPTARIIKKMPEDAEIVMFPRDVLGVVERYFGSANATSGRAREVLNWIDTVTDAWRSWTLFPIPAYHIRNILSNSFLLWLGGHANINSFNQATRMLHNLRLFKKGKRSYEDTVKVFKEAHLIDSFGNQVSAFDLWSQAIREGVFSGNLHFNEMHYGQIGAKTLGEFEQLWHAMGALPSSDLTNNFLLDNKLLRGGRSLGQSAEDVFRLSAFVEAWKKTGSFKEAGMEVKKIFYNYKDLSMFERRVLRRFIPFYSWSRFNIPRMIETMFTRPITHYRIGKLFESLSRQANGGAPFNEEDLPEWMQKRFGIPVYKDDDGTYIIRTLDTLIPAYEAYGFFTNGLATEFGERIKNGITPVLKLPAEMLFNKSLFTNKDIERFDGEPAKGFLYSQLGFTRGASTKGPLGILNTVLNEQFVQGIARPVDYLVDIFDAMADVRTLRTAQPTFWAGLLDLGLGKSYIVDPQKSRMLIYRDWSKTQSALTGAYRYALSTNDSVAADFFLERLNEFRLTKPPGFPQ